VGGTNGWASVTAKSAITGVSVNRKQNKTNQVLLWTIDNMAAGSDAHLE
jgi:hypothetical protein